MKRTRNSSNLKEGEGEITEIWLYLHHWPVSGKIAPTSAITESELQKILTHIHL